MIVEAKDYYLDHEDTPTNDELLEFLNLWLKHKNKSCRFTLHWHVPYSGWYKVVAKDEDKTIDDLRARMPSIYGI